MRIVFTGITPMTIKAAKEMINHGHELVLIEINKDKIDRVSDDLDCSFLHGDSSKPAVLLEAAPKACDFLFCLTDSDQANIITSLLGRTMGFKKIITCIRDEDLLSLCDELGLEYVIVPDRTMSQYLENIVHGLDTVELSTLLKGKARFFSFKAGDKEAIPLRKLDLPEQSKVIYYYRDTEFHFADEDTTLKKGDEVVILTNIDQLDSLAEKWAPQNTDNA